LTQNIAPYFQGGLGGYFPAGRKTKPTKKEKGTVKGMGSRGQEREKEKKKKKKQWEMEGMDCISGRKLSLL